MDSYPRPVAGQIEMVHPISATTREPDMRTSSVARRADSIAPANRPVTVRVEHVVVCRAGSEILADVSFQCREGEWTLITGPSGSGKSTLLNTINGLVMPSRGTVWTLGSTVVCRNRREARLVWGRTGTVLQEAALFETKSVRTNVELGLRAAGFDRPTARKTATHWLARLGLAAKMDSYPGRLSGGEKQRVALARAMAPAPRLLLMDEPTSALDVAAATVVMAAVRELAAGGTTVIMSSHRQHEVVHMCDQHLHLQCGIMVAQQWSDEEVRMEGS